MAHTHRYIFDNLSAEYKTFDDKKRITELKELIQNQTFGKKLRDFKKGYSDRNDILSNIGDSLYDLAVSLVETKKKSSTSYAMKYLLQEYQLGYNPLNDVISTPDKDGNWIRITNPNKKTEHQLIKIIESIVIDLE